MLEAMPSQIDLGILNAQIQSIKIKLLSVLYFRDFNDETKTIFAIYIIIILIIKLNFHL